MNSPMPAGTSEAAAASAGGTGLRFDRREWAGAFGDLGTLVPFLLAYVNPDIRDDVFELYRKNFKPGVIAKPYAMLTVFSICADTEAEAKRLRNRLRQMDRRLDEHLAAAAKQRITREQLQKLSVTTAAERLKLEEALEDVEHKITEQSDDSERRKARERALARLLDGWKTLAIDEKQTLLRELVDRVVVHDEGVQVHLRP